MTSLAQIDNAAQLSSRRLQSRLERYRKSNAAMGLNLLYKFYMLKVNSNENIKFDETLAKICKTAYDFGLPRVCLSARTHH